MEQQHFIATTTFGLEATVKREAIKLGFQNITVLDGRVDFDGGIETIAIANTWLRSAGRVHLKMGTFTAVTFDELFEQTKALPWADWITEDGEFTVIGKSVKSTLFSISDCQAIVKKAIVEKLKLTYNTQWFEEMGPAYKVQVSILKDVCTLTIDTSGTGLHKRGYRENAGAAPLKETLAAAMIELSYWNKSRVLLDPVCGSGTIPIEAALMAKNIAPGLYRTFACEQWPQIPAQIWKDVRGKASAAILSDFTPEIYASDMDPIAIELAKSNAKKAGVDDCIRFETKPLKNVALPQPYGVVICNPPYGERIGEQEEIVQLYKEMGQLFRRDKTWSFYAITSYENFEKCFGQKATSKRKLFNGMLKIDYYQYHGQRPPRTSY